MSKEAFKTQYGPAAKRAADKLDVPEDVILAHWGLETGWGKSVVPGTNNLGNIKDFAGGGVAAKDNLTGTTDKYRTFDTAEAFADHYADLIVRKHPGAVGKKTGMDFGNGLRATGYMEDAAAPQKLARIMKEPVQDMPAPVPDQRVAAISAGIRASIQRPLPLSGSKARLDAEVNTDRSVAEAQAFAAPSLWESFAGAVAGNTDSEIYKGITERIWGPKHQPEAGYLPDFEMLKERTAGAADRDMVEDFGKTRSAAEAEEMLNKYDDEQMRIKAVMGNGTAIGMGMTFLAEVPAFSNILPGVGVAKALAKVKMGSQFLAMEGAGYGKVAAAAIGENAISGAGVEAVRQMATGEYNLADFGLAIAVDSVIGAAAAGLDMRTAGKLSIDNAAAASVAREFDLHQRAVAKLGPDASSAEIKQAVQEIATTELSSVVGDAVTRNATLKLDGELSYDLQTSTRFANSANALEEQRVSTLDKRWGELRQLGLDLPDDNTAVGRATAIAALDATPKVHIASNAKSSLKFAQYGEALESLRKQFLPDVAIHITDGKARLQGNNLGVHAIVKPGVSVLGLRTDSGITTAIHEFGHAVFAHRLARLPEAEKQAMEGAWREWQQKYMTPGKAQEAALQRSPVGTAGRVMPDGSEPFAAAAAKGDFSESFEAVWDKAFPGNQAQADAYARYYGNFDEYSAEQFAKYIEAEVAGVGSGKLTLPQQIVRAISYLIQQAAEIFKFAKAKKLIKPDEPFAKFFDDLLMGNEAKGLASADEALVSGLEFMSVPAKPATVVDEFMNDPDAARFGLTIAPVSTAMERKQAQAMLALHKKAEEWAKTNPKDAEWDARAQNLADNNVYSVASAGMVMLKSESPLLRMIASELVEDASGISGKRNSTAAISKYITERFMLGNAINDIEGAYGFWSKGKPGGIKDDLIGGKNRAEFDRLIASEIEARRDNRGALTQDPNVKAAADSTEAAYQRIANEQRRVQTIGWEGLPESSKGYMPHRMSAKAVINLTNEQGRVLHDALVDQFVTVEGWDMSFSDKLASTYMKRVRDRASGDYGSSFGGNTSAESDVEEALRAMDLPEDVIEGHMKKFKKGGAGFTKGRIELDLNRPHMLADGSEFKLLSVFETNQIELLRAQAGRASGEVALTKHGVQGKPGLKLLRDALSFGEDGKRAAVRELEAFDQMAAEFMNEPFGKSNNRFLQRAMAANTLVRLGGIAFNQLAESINGIVHVGVGRTLSSIGSIKRLRSEIIALSKGQKVDNPLLSSIELAGGQFGTDAYKFVLPYDSPDHLYPTYGQDTLTAADRLLRGGTHVQSVLSGWRMIHSAQQRGMAEQIVHKMMRYVREGKDDVALEQFGINARVRAQLRADLPQVAKFDGNTLVEFDVTKISDPAVRDEVIQAVWRGTAQIIQGTFIGETAKWAHSDLGKLMTQFRTFSLTSMEKQWGRQRNSRGAYAAFGILMGSMAMAAPIYMARVYAASVGREDQEEFLAERLETQAIARATLNYVAMSGMAGDFMDLLSAGLPEELGVKPTGGRAGVESTFIGNYVAPASSLVDDIWKYAQSPADMNDLTKIMPMSRLPYLVPLVNEAKE